MPPAGDDHEPGLPKKPNAAFGIAFVVTVVVLTVGIILLIRWVLGLIL